jgi:hypothetical protein
MWRRTARCAWRAAGDSEKHCWWWSCCSSSSSCARPPPTHTHNVPHAQQLIMSPHACSLWFMPNNQSVIRAELS